MSELLLELLSEEIPARMQSRAAEDLHRLVVEALAAAQLGFGTARSFVAARRLTLVVEGLPAAQPDVSEERRGPRLGAPEQAIQGFLKTAGIESLAECETRDTGKGVFYIATIRRAGRPTAEVLPEILRKAVLSLPWPKSMRFPAASFRWVRPLSQVLCLFGGKILPIDLDLVPVGDATLGHRFLSPGTITVRDFADYALKLDAAHVIFDQTIRRQKIADDLALAARKEGLELKEDPGLLDEVTGLAEYPVVLAGRIDARFMTLPPEVLTTSMRVHQKYFALTEPDGRLAPRFLLVANTLAADGGAAIVAGNERVLRARLSDAEFFWDQDRRTKLGARVPKLAERIFHAKLGSMLDKAARIEALAAFIAPSVKRGDLNLELARRAARLAKADLSSGMVGEFPELQGLIGRYYALHDHEPPEIADAVAEHYAPLGPSDRCPAAPVSVTVALADKIDTLVGFFGIDEKPTGSKDPFALRRAALGVIRLILENRLRLPLLQVFAAAGRPFPAAAPETGQALLDFFADRLKVHLREQGVRHDLIQAIFALGGEDDLVRLLARVAALDEFLKTEDGANLLTAYRRASNIVRIEEKKDGRSHDGMPDPGLFRQDEEQEVASCLGDVEALTSEALCGEAFGTAMTALARLRLPLDEFFDRVTVNCEDTGIRQNRLRLLSFIRRTFHRLANFSQIEG